MRPAYAPFIVFLCACQGATIDDPTLRAATDQTLHALETGDMAELWGLTDTPTKTKLLETLRDAERARARVPEVWSEADRTVALSALGGEFFAKLGPDDEGRGPRLLSAATDTRRLTFDEGTLEGLAPRDVTFDPGPPRRALILTAAGERLTFTQEGEAWKSLLVRDRLLESAFFRALAEQATKTNALAEENLRLWRVSLDPATPQGAYNLARTAQERKPQDVDMLFALIDEDARKTLVEVLEASRKAQRQLQQRLAKPQRREAYEAGGLLRQVEAASDRDLFKKWAASGDWSPPLAATDEPVGVVGDLASGAVVVVTTSGAKVPMKLDSDGIWRLGGLRTRIATALSTAAPNAPASTP